MILLLSLLIHTLLDKHWLTKNTSWTTLWRGEWWYISSFKCKNLWQRM